MEELPQLRSAIHSFVLAKVRDAALADDLTQETLLRMQSRIHTLKAVERLHPWVLQIARNVIADHFRRRRDMEIFEEATHGASLRDQNATSDVDDDDLSRELSDYVRSVVHQLPPPYRDAILMTEFDGVPQVELARRLGLSISAVKSRVQRGRAMLRKEMERCCRWETDRYGNVLGVEPRSTCACGEDPGTCKK
jgi:RNA polymerase sigma-70 factor (ECF subfamily)